MAVYLVRHAKTIEDRNTPAAEWRLNPDDLDSLAVMASVLPQHESAFWYSSPELKAKETAERLTTKPVVEVPSLGEVRRSGWDPNYFHTVSRFFAEPDVPPSPGWETARDAEQRFLTSFSDIVRKHPLEADIVVVTHGLVLTLLRARCVPGDTPMQLWEQQSCPDLYALPDEAQHALRDGAEMSAAMSIEHIVPDSAE